MYPKEKVTEILQNPNKDDFVKRLEVASLISQNLAEMGTTSVVVGGSAVEFYTWATYATQDIDFIVTDPTHVKECMEQLGFKNNGAVWSFPETDLIVEFPAGPLDGRFDKIQPVKTSVGTLDIIGIEDIIIDRSARKQYWGDADEWAKYMVMAHHDVLDWDYLKERAKDASCLETIMHLKKIYKKNIGDISADNPKRKQAVKSASYQEYISEIKSFKKGPSSKLSSDRELYMAYAKPFIPKDEEWVSGIDEQIIQAMLKDNIDIYKVKRSLMHSPAFIKLDKSQKMVKGKELWKKAQKNPEIEKMLQQVIER